MKLNDEKPYVETSGDLQEQFFSIQDQGMIFDILRNKMYSNPILAICREISCNARDAHREVGKNNEPIHIYLPNAIEPYFKIKDFGPGISPDRMSNVFIKYTASTKREDNVQTGGFGLGAKTPFSYSDSFSIVTNYNGTRYNYTCFIDETKVGKLAELSRTSTEEPNSTEIIIPVKPSDFTNFSNWIEHATRHWIVKPIFNGRAIDYRKLNIVLTGKDWVIETTEKNNYQYNSSHRESLYLIVDGMEYPVSLDALNTYADLKLVHACRGSLYLYFGVGELSLSANREQIYLDPKTKDAIRSKLNDVEAEIKDSINEKIKTFTNLWQANLYYKADLIKAFSDVNWLRPLMWNGIELTDHSINTGCNVFNFYKGSNSRYYSRRSSDPNKIKREIRHSIYIEENSLLILNDLNITDPTSKHVKLAFDQDPKLKTVQVVTPTDKVPLNMVNDNCHLDKMNPALLSNYTKASNRKYTPPSARLLVFKFYNSPGRFGQVSYSAMEEDTKSKILCFLKKDSFNNNRSAILANGKEVSHQLLSYLESKHDIVFYGVDQSADANRIAEDFAEFVTLDKFITDKFSIKIKDEIIRLKLAKQAEIDLVALRYLPQLKKKIDKNSLFIKNLEAQDSFKKTETDEAYYVISSFETLHGNITDHQLTAYAKLHPECDVEKMQTEVNDKYPMLQYIDRYQYGKAITDITDYINLTDKN